MSHSSTINSETIRANDSGLVETPEDFARGSLKSLVAGLVVTIFLGLITVGGVIDAFWPSERPTLIGQEKIEDEELRANAKFGDGSLARWIEREARIRSRVRQLVEPRYALLRAQWFREGRNNVLVGSDSWLFLRTRATPRDASDAEIVSFGSNLVNTVHRRLTAMGCQLTVCPIPRKPVVEAADFHSQIDVRPQLYSEFVSSLRNRGISTVDLLSAWRESEERHMFHKLDTHWNEPAMRLAAEAVCREMGLMVPEPQRLNIMRESSHREGSGDLSKLLGLEDFLVELPSKTFEARNKEGRRLRRNASPKEMTRIALVGTSYSKNTMFHHFLAHYMGEEIFSGARGGAGPVRPLQDMMRGSKRIGFSERLIWELPCYNLFADPPMRRHEELLQTIRPPQTRTLLRQKALMVSEELNKTERVTNLSNFVVIPQNLVVHRGDGMVGIQIRANVSGGSAWLVARTESQVVKVLWDSSTKSVFVPLFGETLVRGGTISILARSPLGAFVDLQNVELVDDLDESGSVLGQAGDLQVEGSNWQQDFRFSSNPIVSPCAAIELIAGNHDQAEFLIQVLSASGEISTLIEAGGLSAQGRLLLSIPSHEGKELHTVRVRGIGNASNTAITSVRLLPVIRAAR